MNYFINKAFRRQNGSLTVEAALVLPLFICAVLTIGYLTKIVYIHETVQHAIDEAVNEMASSSYLYYVSGAYDIDNTLSNELDERKERSEEHINSIRDSYEELNDSISQIGSSSKDIYEGVDRGNINETSGENIGGSIGKIEAVIQDMADDPKGEMISLAALMAKVGYDKGKTALGNALIEHYIKKYSLTDEGLKKLNINDFDLGSSSYFNNNEDIDVIVKYNVSIPLPIKFISSIPIVQRSTARAWMGGESSSIGLEEDAEEGDFSDKKEDDGKTEDVDEAEEEDEAIKVYVSKKASRSYHRFGCYWIFKEIEALDLKDVRELGLGPCKKCDPPMESTVKYTVFKSKRSDDGKYHEEGCTHLFKEIMEIDLDEAVKKYNPCKTCKPPREN